LSKAVKGQKLHDERRSLRSLASDDDLLAEVQCFALHFACFNLQLVWSVRQLFRQHTRAHHPPSQSTQFGTDGSADLSADPGQQLNTSTEYMYSISWASSWAILNCCIAVSSIHTRGGRAATTHESTPSLPYFDGDGRVDPKE
jgi:hypothetical protein